MERTSTEIVNDFYNEVMFTGQNQFWDKIGFCNIGYWDGLGDECMEIAQINLLEKLSGFFTNRDGNVLDVACGKGATTRFLTKYFEPKNITGINISERQLEVCRIVAPECQFRLMDATKLDFADSSVDNILCVEAALHFMTRQKFFEEACRVLKNGAKLAMSDILFEKAAMKDYPSWFEENYVPNLPAYKDCLLDAGFKYVRVEDMTDSYRRFHRYSLIRREREFEKRRDYKPLELTGTMADPSLCGAFCIAYAIK